ncbi:hypothetical protein BDW02DRAFT_414676 [Decorospora gaudefroyi]|uniref:RanBP2-type domain-containing protein n=1 Tax=Decorospora gaudefroyi TaxID=184978 RepID=A0A6A5KQN3_9PLEO|nr:hypothetical protein BDW02DRAFT_414676 [Decorospora gaudefroyi]
MARPNTPTVPLDMWICGSCKNGNLITLTDHKCPVCSHTKDACCTGPGEPYPKTTNLFPGNPDFQFPCSRATMPYYPGCPAQHEYPSSSTTFPQAPEDVWTCNECGATNCSWVDVCPVCNRGSRASMMSSFASATPTYSTPMFSYNYDMSPSSGYYSYGPAGSSVDGYWQCSQCGLSNGPLNDYCADSDCGAAKP